MTSKNLAGVYAAALTPLKADFSPDLEAIHPLLAFYAQRGCHGALLLGTTGEGPSFAPEERTAIYRAALRVRQEFPDFRLMAGTGTPSLAETTSLTRAAFDLGFDAVVVLPPYYFRKATDEGLLAWFNKVIEQAVPSDGALLGYHIPGVSGVPLSLDLLSRLKDAHPQRFAGIKDSSGDPKHAEQLGARFGSDLTVLTGDDRLLSFAMQNQAAGCITAMANLFSPSLRIVWDAHQRGDDDLNTQAQLDAWRTVLESYQPYATSLKKLMHRMHGFPEWPVRPPLLPLPNGLAEKAFEELEAATKQ
ncbi:MAG: dihydrodipicolinate synthase family protein [Anaerolineales bacterium]|nr:dihydrodipicolinate synthase family protein [Chloroflexota bacterium]MBL7163628.1 dihydrodipicolinate synthase family protein [Anaerolineales bacterium]